MTDRSVLDAVSPLDGRYARYTDSLRSYASEAALQRARTRVEVEYLIALADLDATPIEIGPGEREAFRAVYDEFDDEDAQMVKRIETEGYGEYAATNHDVKAVEYLLRERLPERLHPWIHFGLTSEDATNLAYRLLVKDALSEVLVPAAREVRDRLAGMAREHRDLPMLAHTHGQPATPTTFGKEMAVYAARLGRALGRVDGATDDLAGKLGGASGTFAAHVAAYPDVDWQAFSRAFVTGLGLEHAALTTQVNPGDDLAVLFDALSGLNQVVIDLDRDAWLYVSDRYLGQEAVEEETGSSTMPHKVNPIDFENSEGNLSKANADLAFLSEWLTTSRLQRDLTDSTVKRTVGAALAHCLIGYQKASDGLGTVTPNETVMREDLEANPAVLAEAVQTVLRREGHADAYERVRALTRGEDVTLESLRRAIRDLEVNDAVREELLDLTPAEYVGLASELVGELDGAEYIPGHE
ncbi:MAG: adenylosuccinate lyase [Halobacteriales archaeon]